MPLNSLRLKQKIKDAYTATAATNTDREDGLEVFAAALSAAIIDEIKQATVVYSSGLAAGAVPVAGIFNHTIT